MLRNIAEQQLKGLEILENRTKIDTKDVIKKYGDITIQEVDLVDDGSGGQYSIIVFKESPKEFLFGGKVLTELINGWVDHLGDMEELNKELERDDIVLRLSNVKTKDGKRNYTKVELV